MAHRPRITTQRVRRGSGAAPARSRRGRNGGCDGRRRSSLPRLRAPAHQGARGLLAPAASRGDRRREPPLGQGGGGDHRPRPPCGRREDPRVPLLVQGPRDPPGHRVDALHRQLPSAARGARGPLRDHHRHHRADHRGRPLRAPDGQRRGAPRGGARRHRPRPGAGLPGCPPDRERGHRLRRPRGDRRCRARARARAGRGRNGRRADRCVDQRRIDRRAPLHSRAARSGPDHPHLR